MSDQYDGPKLTRQIYLRDRWRTAREARIEGMIEPYSDKDKRIRDLEAEVRALRSAGYSCPTCDNDAKVTAANPQVKPDAGT